MQTTRRSFAAAAAAAPMVLAQNRAMGRTDTARADLALIVVDVQVGFIPGGNLPVPKGDEVVPLINRLAARYRNVLLTQDWHPADHMSFASQHPGKKPFETVQMP